MNPNSRFSYRVTVSAAIATALATGAYGQLPIPAATKVYPPTNVTANADSSNQITLTWTASLTSGVTYNVYENTISGFQPSASSLVSSGIAATKFTQQGLQSATTYYFVVSAVLTTESF